MSEAPPPPSGPRDPSGSGDSSGSSMPPPPPGGGYSPPPSAPGGSAEPPGAGYGSQPGYGQPGGGHGAPMGGPSGPGGASQLSESDERMWAMLSHIGAVLLGFLAPLIAMLVQGDKSPFVRANSVESLNFQITLLIVGIPLTVVTCGFGAVIFMVGWIFEILGGIKANQGEQYRYPVNIRLVK